MKTFILALDQGTTSSRAILFDREGKIQAASQKEFKQIFPQPGWVEHDPEEIWSSQILVASEVLRKKGINGKMLAGIGITNQRETTIVWDRLTGKPVYNAIVWQDRRTSDICDEFAERGLAGKIREKTGLVIDAYFSATKLKWILGHVEGAGKKAERGELAFGTVDTWLVWKLTRGRRHITDVSNACRTMLFNINTLKWDKELLEIFGIPYSMLPEVVDSSEIYDESDPSLFGAGVPVGGIAGDQQAAMFGQMCVTEGMVKNTYGTGCFILMNTGEKPFYSDNNLITTIAWKIGDHIHYALEGSIFIGGAVVQWLRDGLGIIKSSSETEGIAGTVQDNGNVYFVPAFTGLGAPYWDPHARGLIMGISRGTNKGHIVRAALESIAFQTMDVLDVMKKDTRINIRELRVDGGASANNFLMQFQSDVLGIPVVRSGITETTALGAAYLAGLAVNFWTGLDELKEHWQSERIFNGKMKPSEAERLKGRWAEAVKLARGWNR